RLVPGADQRLTERPPAGGGDAQQVLLPARALRGRRQPKLRDAPERLEFLRLLLAHASRLGETASLRLLQTRLPLAPLLSLAPVHVDESRRGARRVEEGRSRGDV